MKRGFPSSFMAGDTLHFQYHADLTVRCVTLTNVYLATEEDAWRWLVKNYTRLEGDTLPFLMFVRREIK